MQNFTKISHNEKFSDSLAEFSRVVSRSREIFTETFIETSTFTDSESFNESSRLLDTTRQNLAR